ncbi:MAG: 50S ribosomal protein L3 [Oscillospiraceae bacterium]|nr:50S ribosomal protein L3 [Oscillospiraceae bacterium]
MKKGIIGRKIGMTQIFDEAGKFIPVTVVEAGPCVVTQKKTLETDGYEAVQLGFGDRKPTKTIKPLKGHFEKSSVPFKRYLREFRLDDSSAMNTGDTIKVDVFAEGDFIDAAGISKGKGFAGTIKRYGNSRLPESHGTGPVARHAGSMGGSAYPGKIPKGKKMPGHMGAERVTVQNLKVVKVDADNNLVAIKGAVPGPNGGLVILTSAVKK